MSVNVTKESHPTTSTIPLRQDSIQFLLKALMLFGITHFYLCAFMLRVLMRLEITFLSGLVTTFSAYILDAPMDSVLMSFKIKFMCGLVITFIAFVLDAPMDRSLMSFEFTFFSCLVITFLAFVSDAFM